MKAPMSRFAARLLSHPKTARVLSKALKEARETGGPAKISYEDTIQLVEVEGKKARWDVAKGILIDPPFGPWPRRCECSSSHTCPIHPVEGSYDPHWYEPPEDFPDPEGMPGAPTLGWHDKFNRHMCCWLWKIAVLIPILHIVLHLLNIPHPEVLSFIP